EHGPGRSFEPNPPGYDPFYHAELAIKAGCNAYAAPLGFIEAVARKYAGRLPLILKVNNSDLLGTPPAPHSALTSSVKDALRLGCVAVGFT
ncbi:MAG: fructose-bisphosphate aldolase, partial [Sandaracinaceae bacterium]|nr:fructose-bisphosphate aldolase [Sandaracinaceae bacterium]